MATKAKIPQKPPKGRTWSEFFGMKNKKKSLKGLGEVPETNGQGAIKALTTIGGGLAGGVIGSALGGTMGFVSGLVGAVAGVFMDNDALSSAGVGAVIGSMVQKPTLSTQKEQSFSEKAKANSNYFLENLKSVTMLDQLGKKKEEVVVVKVDAGKAISTMPNFNFPANTTKAKNEDYTDNCKNFDMKIAPKNKVLKSVNKIMNFVKRYKNFPKTIKHAKNKVFEDNAKNYEDWCLFSEKSLVEFSDLIQIIL
jgi:predicted lipid-binding transport protein (Tim44 family)